MFLLLHILEQTIKSLTRPLLQNIFGNFNICFINTEFKKKKKKKKKLLDQLREELNLHCCLRSHQGPAKFPGAQ